MPFNKTTTLISLSVLSSDVGVAGLQNQRHQTTYMHSLAYNWLTQ